MNGPRCPYCNRAYVVRRVKQRFHISMFSIERLNWSIAVLSRAAVKYPELREAIVEEQVRLGNVIVSKLTERVA